MGPSRRGPGRMAVERIGPLAVLPVFFDLRGRRCVVAGGSEAAAWKAELLAAAGAAVTVFASNPSEAMEALIQGGSASGTVRMMRRPWSPEDLADASLVVGDLPDDGEARVFCQAARAAGVPVNVIDKPTFCDFRFGAIVNRSPVVIGLSTDGAAPVLAQALRQRVEALLPKGIGAWASSAMTFRARLKALLPDAGARRRFWSWFVETAFTSTAHAPSHAELAEKARDLGCGAKGQGNGSVVVVGAGPGDPELLTMKALRALRGADVILFDSLVAPEILELARREARRLFVGKRSGRESCRQDEINALLLAFAGQGRRVVRLKVGDPTISDRDGEEIENLRHHGIPVEIVPGVTAASDAAARRGASLTHRGPLHASGRGACVQRRAFGGSRLGRPG